NRVTTSQAQRSRSARMSGHVDQNTQLTANGMPEPLNREETLVSRVFSTKDEDKKNQRNRMFKRLWRKNY
ncbi:hypothetical protein QN379_22425, partial [Glaciimonas sp. Gout2]|uniref:hypothetical protein n=1 Tax=Glaciimonas sp. Gout2 TaxID=3048625 RepID=UPI002B22FBCD